MFSADTFFNDFVMVGRIKVYMVSDLSTFERFAIQANGCYPRNCRKIREKQSTHKLRTCQIESFEMLTSFFACQVYIEEKYITKNIWAIE